MTAFAAPSLRVEALRLLGGMLRATPRNKGANGSIVTGTHREPVKDDSPTLADLEITKKESSVAQRIAALPDDKFERLRSGEVSISQVASDKAHVNHNAGDNEWGKL